MKNIKRFYGFKFLVIAVFSLALTDAAYCEHRQDKQLSKYLLKLEDELIKRTVEADEILYRSGAIYEDKETSEYINGVAQKVIPPDFNDEKININLKIIRDPTINAFALPTGTIYIAHGPFGPARKRSPVHGT